MTIDDNIKDEKLQCDINRETAKISVLPSGKFYKNEYLTGEEILPPDQGKITERAKIRHSPLGKAFEKHTKAVEDQGVNQIEALKALKPKGQKEDIKSIEDISKRDEN